MVVTDDGCGLPPITVRSGLANLADRAERRGGRLTTSGRRLGHRGQLGRCPRPVARG